MRGQESMFFPSTPVIGGLTKALSKGKFQFPSFKLLRRCYPHVARIYVCVL